MYKLIEFSENHSFKKNMNVVEIYLLGELQSSELYEKPLYLKSKSDFYEAKETPPIEVGDLQDYLILKIVE